MLRVNTYFYMVTVLPEDVNLKLFAATILHRCSGM